MLKHYTAKLAGLDNLDQEFFNTMESQRLLQQSPGRRTTDQLLKTIYMPKDLLHLSGYLPAKNYLT